MNARLNNGNVLLTAQRILGLAGLASLALACAGPAWAQSRSAQPAARAMTSPAAALATSPGVQSSGATSVLKQTSVQNSTSEAPAPKGQSEGVKVHGHWVILVKNPDGKVARRVEFENSLQQQGKDVLAALLSRSSTAGAWLVGVGTGQGGVGPCPTGNGFTVPTPSGNMIIGSTCQAVEVTGNYLGSVGCAGAAVDPATCSPTLTVQSVQVGQSGTGLQLTGTATATATSTTAAISIVFTALNTCSNPTGSGNSTFAPETCTTAGPSRFAGTFTAVTLPQQGSGTCGGVNQLPCAVPVAVGQTITMTVTISFN